MKAAIYCRVSTPDQEREGTSLESQEAACLKLAEERGYDLLDDYVFKEVYSGADMDRPKLNTFRSLIREKEVDAAISYSTDRLARNPIHIAIIAEECEKQGIELIFVSEPMDNSPEGALIRYVKGYSAQIDREKIRERTMRGKRTRAQSGKLPTGGLNLYGYLYNKETGKRSILPDEAQVIRKMIDYVLKDRVSLNEVCRRLMTDNIPAPKGGQKWSRATVGRILNNEVYTGKTFCMRMKAVEPKNRVKFSRHKNTARELLPREEWLQLPDDTTPQIITREEFEALRTQFARNRELSPRNQKFQYLLRGFIYCLECGRKYYGNPVHGKRYYRCSGRSSVLNFGQRCDTSLINADQIEAKVWGLVLRNTFDPDEWIKMNHIQSNDDLQLEQLKEELKKSQERLGMLDSAETRLIRLFEFTQMSEAKFKTEHERIRDERAREAQKASSLENEIKNEKIIILTDNEIRALAVILKEIMVAWSREEEQFAQKRLILEACGLKVNISRESFTVDIKIPSQPPREYCNTVLQRC